MAGDATLHRAPQVTAAAEAALRHVGIADNPYLRALEDGSMSLEQFRRTQEQFYVAVWFYPRPMAALVARIPDPRARKDILHNLVEEHGEFHDEAIHEATFRRFLRSIGSPVQDFEHLPRWPEVRAFNCVLTAACLMDEIEVGVCCMGVIEQAFAGISARIGRAVVARGFVRSEDLVHYRLHASVDERHAEEFFAVVEAKWVDPARRYFVEQGLAMGAYVFDRLYRDLLLGALRGQAFIRDGSAPP
jgi:pyrroloquinoline-quinone synthase